jgi:hypothetical protein
MDHHRPAPNEEVPIVPRSRRALWLACWEGRLPAEVLDTRDREDLVWHLHQRRWTDREIAEHTCMTEYTTARIRTRLELGVNEPIEGAA